jgi:hypothetical protein
MGLDGVTHIPNAGALVAHEMGHILGNAQAHSWLATNTGHK